jgi:hypothetical protein
MDKVCDQIVAAHVVLGDVSGSNPNVLYEVGLAHAYKKLVIFLTQDKPEEAPVDIRQFDFITYDLARHVEFLSKIDNAMNSLYGKDYQPLHETAKALLRQLNKGLSTNYEACSLEEFRARVLLRKPTEDIPEQEDKRHLAEFLLPKIIMDWTDMSTIRKVDNWIEKSFPESPPS